MADLTDEEAVTLFERAAGEATSLEDLNIAWELYSAGWKERSAATRETLFRIYRARYAKLEPPDV